MGPVGALVWWLHWSQRTTDQPFLCEPQYAAEEISPDGGKELRVDRGTVSWWTEAGTEAGCSKAHVLRNGFPSAPGPSSTPGGVVFSTQIQSERWKMNGRRVSGGW
ncbi:unnamed protein product [Pleuronectes platessa]|uniref:Uncharacterized protein n=1 Tax=Pleuronectes platessa TaxID=8262 RepID=A0A9N7YAU7_PLEPL|nr:unnamed protein product [Pleuronectes platessa]